VKLNDSGFYEMGTLGRGGEGIEFDTEPFDRAVAGILHAWDPPIDIKKVIMSELGAVLGKASNETLMVGPKGKKNKAFRGAHAYIKKRYTWGKRMEKGKNKGKAKMDVSAVPAVRVGNKLYFRVHYHQPYVWTAIQKKLSRLRKTGLKAAGSSKAAWFLMFDQAMKVTGTKVPRPKSWKHQPEIRKVLKFMKKRSSKWTKATTAEDESKGPDFVLKVYSEAHNTLNKGTKGIAEFQSALNGRQAYMERVLGKKMKASMEKLLKKYPGLDTGL